MLQPLSTGTQRGHTRKGNVRRGDLLLLLQLAPAGVMAAVYPLLGASYALGIDLLDPNGPFANQSVM